MDWQELYRQKLTTAAEAVKVVRSGDTVMVPIFPPATLSPALAARRGELTGFTGVDDPYEPPVGPELALQTEHQAPIDNARCIRDWLVSHGYVLSPVAPQADPG